jgi:hypothetical protein
VWSVRVAGTTHNLHANGVTMARPRGPAPSDNPGEPANHPNAGRGARPDYEVGVTSMMPTPRTMRSNFGSAAVSPSLRRSHDTWTSTVCSAPK